MTVDPIRPFSPALAEQDILRRLTALELATRRPAASDAPWLVKPGAVPVVTLPGNGVTHVPWVTGRYTVYPGVVRLWVATTLTPGSSTTAATLEVARSLTAPGAVFTDTIIASASVPGNSSGKYVSGIVQFNVSDHAAGGGYAELRFQVTTPNTGVTWAVLEAQVRPLRPYETELPAGLTVS